MSATPAGIAELPAPRAPFDRALLLVVPATAFMLALFIYPFVYGLILSFEPPQGGWLANYQKFFTMVFPRMDKGGLFLGHNVINKRDEMPDFLKTIHTSPAVLTSIVAPSGEGVSISLKR